MKSNKTYSIATLIAAACLASSGIQAAPRSTPVTVVNDATTPVPVEVISAGDRYVFVGPSVDETTGEIGHIGMNSLCNNTYVSSRMCTTAEFLTYSPKSVPLVSMWLNPTYIHGFTSGDNVMDQSGLTGTTRGTLNCARWSSPAERGIQYFYDIELRRGTINGAPCSSRVKVACCAP